MKPESPLNFHQLEKVGNIQTRLHILYCTVQGKQATFTNAGGKGIKMSLFVYEVTVTVHFFKILNSILP